MAVMGRLQAPGRPWGEIWLLGGLTLVTVAGNTSVTLAQPAVAATFNAGPADVGWIVFGYSAAFAVSAVVFGYVGRALGLERALGAGVLIFAAASGLAAFAPSLPVLIGLRIAQGAGAGAIPPLSASLVAARLTEQQRPRGLGIIVAGVASGLAVAPIVAGLALEFIGWEAVVALGIVALPAARYLFVGERSETNWNIDLIGLTLVAAGGFGAAYFLNRFPLGGFTSATLVALAVAVVTTVIVLARSRSATKTGRERVLPMTIVGRRVFIEVAALGAVGMSVFIGTAVLVPLVAENAYGLSGLWLGLLYLPMALVAAAFSLRNAQVQARLGGRLTTAISLFLLAAGALAQALAGFTGGSVAQALLLPILGAGYGLLSAPLLNRLTTAFSGPDRPVAVGTYNLCYFLGGALGGAVATGIVQSGFALSLIPAGTMASFQTAELLLVAAPVVAAIVVLMRAAEE